MIGTVDYRKIRTSVATKYRQTYLKNSENRRIGTKFEHLSTRQRRTIDGVGDIVP